MKKLLIADTSLDVKGQKRRLRVRLYQPVRAGADWACAFSIGAPLSVSRKVYGVSAIQSVALALQVLSAYIYASRAFKAGQLGFAGEFGGILPIPRYVQPKPKKRAARGKAER